VHELLDGFDRPARAHVIPRRELAIRWTLDQARAGDTVVIAGCSRTAGLGDPSERPICADAETARSWLRGERKPTLKIHKASIARKEKRG
jgi:UDP-N-acetylmuramoyl-L-alanyl-D-glutamate--2,6-diaminopimelate ligase